MFQSPPENVAVPLQSRRPPIFSARRPPWHAWPWPRSSLGRLRHPRPPGRPCPSRPRRPSGAYDACHALERGPRYTPGARAWSTCKEPWKLAIYSEFSLWKWWFYILMLFESKNGGNARMMSISETCRMFYVNLVMYRKNKLYSFIQSCFFLRQKMPNVPSMGLRTDLAKANAQIKIEQQKYLGHMRTTSVSFYAVSSRSKSYNIILR